MSEQIDAIKKYVRAANYLSAAQIYLLNNFLLKQKLSPDDIKPRLLGHWGTAPGINFVYAHLNALIKRERAQFLFVLGPGHGFAALQANLFIESTLGKYYPEAIQNESGVEFLCKSFSWPYAFPSHSNPGAPGVIVEGGELGYALSTSYGAILDNPDLIAACIVGDGEAETGATATAWHINKFIDPAVNGAVLPILHLNGYKISGPTIMGRMTNRELKSLFYGYGYDPHIVDGGAKIYETMADTLDLCYRKIRAIQEKARATIGPLTETPRFPMIILRTPKGWTGIKKLGTNKIEGNCLSHQVVAGNCKTDAKELRAVRAWLESYKFNELFTENGFDEEIKNLVPDPELRMGDNRHAFGSRSTVDLKLPDANQFAEDANIPGTMGSSSMRRVGLYLNEVIKLNAEQRNFRFFSPDETYSNKLDAIFENTKRAFVWPIKEWDRDMARDGRVIEMLSEHTLQGLTQGYVLTGRHAIFASYEAFMPIVGSMMDQYAKFLKIARDIPWRGAVPSLNYILTSSGWRQEHNGFSHQNPSFIDDLLQRHGNYAHVYFPPDGNSTLAVLKKCLSSRNEINIIAAGKTQEPRWLTPELAQKELENGLMIWDFASDDNPDIVFAPCGDYLTKEMLAAIMIVKSEEPSIRMRLVNIMELSPGKIGSISCALNPHEFKQYFTEDKPVIFSFHGYPETLKQILYDIRNEERFAIQGYVESGSITTPFDMFVRNHTDRWHLTIKVFKLLAERGVVTAQKADEINTKYRQKLADHRAYIIHHGTDPEEIESWTWKQQ